jgi:hypothetical protein
VPPVAEAHSSTLEIEAGRAPLLVIACGALAREINALRELNRWSGMTVKCLDAELHNHPARIPPRLEATIERYRDHYRRIFVAYADCGTAGRIDRLIERYGIERLPGAHCYSVFAGETAFEGLNREEPGSFYLTDFLVRHFERLVIEALGLREHPELRENYFRHYRRVVYLSQRADRRSLVAARAAAGSLGLAFEHRHCGYGDLQPSLRRQLIAAG